MYGFGNNTEEQLSSTNGIAISTPELIADLDGVTFIEASSLSSHFIYGNSANCVSSTISLTMVPVSNVTISAVGNVLSTISGSAYQWYFNGNPIPGATAQTITATSAGFYSVEVTFGGACTGMSQDYPFNVIGLEELNSSFKVYPNPTNGLVHIVLPNELNTNSSKLFLKDMTGRSVELEFDQSSSLIDIDLSSYSNGVYLLELYANDEMISRKQIVKTN